MRRNRRRARRLEEAGGGVCATTARETRSFEMRAHADRSKPQTRTELSTFTRVVCVFARVVTPPRRAVCVFAPTARRRTARRSRRRMRRPLRLR